MSSTLAAEQRPADPSDPAWRAGLPKLPGDAMRADLERRLGQDAGRARDLLRPLAFAQGQGLPWENIWAPLASRISGHAYTDQDITWLRGTAGSYVVEATEAGRSAYRLYHQALTEYLRSGTDTGSIEAAFVDVLTHRVPRRVGGGRDWTCAHLLKPDLLEVAGHAGRDLSGPGQPEGASPPMGQHEETRGTTSRQSASAAHAAIRSSRCQPFRVGRCLTAARIVIATLNLMGANSTPMCASM